jgi:small subunit ribosomal protein S20
LYFRTLAPSSVKRGAESFVLFKEVRSLTLPNPLCIRPRKPSGRRPLTVEYDRILAEIKKEQQMAGQGTKIKKKKKSVLKRASQSIERAEVNRANRTRVRTLMKRLRTAVSAGDATAAGNLLQPTLSAIDRAITKGVLHENTGNRYKSRLALAHNNLKATAAK